MNIEASTFRVLSNGVIVGNGFLVSRNLVATCAHVVQAAGASPGETVTVRLPNGKDVTAFVDPDFWCEPSSEDISILRLNEPIQSVPPVDLGSSTDSKGHKFSTFGFPQQEQALTGSGTIVGNAFVERVKLLLLNSPQVTPGFSGGAVYDEATKRVVGMIVAIHPPDEYQRMGTTALAIPAEALWRVYTEIRPSDIVPYRGLQTFTEETADYFFGRESFTEKLLDALRAGCRFLAVFGASGSGKSSAVRAGLLVALKTGRIPRSQRWVQITMRPFDNPSEQIRSANLDLGDLNTYLESHPGADCLLLFVDQFEELFTLCNEDVRNHFVNELSQALEHPKLLLVISMRDEFYSAFQNKAAPLAESDRLTVVNIPGSLKNEELMAMIERPAAAVGLSLEEGLAERMAEDLMEGRTAPSSTLPLLEFALTELWDMRRDGVLTHDAYQNIDGVTGSLAHWADTAFSELPKQDRESAKALLTSLVHLGDKTQSLPDSRRRRTLKDVETSAANSRILEYFVNKRLIVTGDDAVELIHNALLVEWHQLSTWLEEDREFFTWREDLNYALRMWKKFHRTNDELLRGSFLLEAEGWLDSHADFLSSEEKEYIRTSVEIRGSFIRPILSFGSKKLSVFLCHSSDDKPSVRKLYKDLCRAGVDAWLDEEKLMPGQDWESEISKAVKSSHVVLVCLSRSSINKVGYVQKEIKFALDIAQIQPENSIYIIPVKLENCEVPQRLIRWQWVNLFENDGYEKLLGALSEKASQIEHS